MKAKVYKVTQVAFATFMLVGVLSIVVANHFTVGKFAASKIQTNSGSK